MKKLFVLLCIVLLLCLTAAASAETEILGQPFPDFTVTDCDGNPFTLSEALGDHEAVLINIWATWCPPCGREFPYLQAAYEAYGDRVAFIALTCEAKDTDAAISAYRDEKGVTFPMASDSPNLAGYLNAVSIPTTVVVDRFGNAAFLHTGSFMDAGEVKRVLAAFVGDGYTQTTVLTEIPADTSTAVFPVAAARDIIVRNAAAQRLTLSKDGLPLDAIAYAVNDDIAQVQVLLTAEDDPAQLYYYDGLTGDICTVSSLLNGDASAYAYAQNMPGMTDDVQYTAGFLLDYTDPEQVGETPIFLIANEDAVEAFMADFRAYAMPGAEWAYAEDAAAAAEQTYTLRVIDQNGDPVSKVNVNFCTDDFCAITMSDENGLITYDGAADYYHLSVLSVPEGYSFDRDAQLNLPAAYGEWLLRVHREE